MRIPWESPLRKVILPQAVKWEAYQIVLTMIKVVKIGFSECDGTLVASLLVWKVLQAPLPVIGNARPQTKSARLYIICIERKTDHSVIK